MSDSKLSRRGRRVKSAEVQTSNLQIEDLSQSLNQRYEELMIKYGAPVCPIDIFDIPNPPCLLIHPEDPSHRLQDLLKDVPREERTLLDELATKGTYNRRLVYVASDDINSLEKNYKLLAEANQLNSRMVEAIILSQMTYCHGSSSTSLPFVIINGLCSRNKSRSMGITMSTGEDYGVSKGGYLPGSDINNNYVSVIPYYETNWVEQYAKDGYNFKLKLESDPDDEESNTLLNSMTQIGLSETESLLLMSNFPVLYGISHYVITEYANPQNPKFMRIEPSLVATDISSERFLKDQIDCESIPLIFVPRDLVEIVKGLIKKLKPDSTQEVYPIEDIVIERKYSLE